jgi:hypothetical protein
MKYSLGSSPFYNVAYSWLGIYRFPDKKAGKYKTVSNNGYITYMQAACIMNVVISGPDSSCMKVMLAK